MLRLRNSRLKRIHVLPSKGSLPRTMRTLSLDRELQTLNDDHCPPPPETPGKVSFGLGNIWLKHNYDDNIRSSYQNRLHRSAGRHRRGSPRTRINLISVRATLTHTHAGLLWTGPVGMRVLWYAARVSYYSIGVFRRKTSSDNTAYHGYAAFSYQQKYVLQ